MSNESSKTQDSGQKTAGTACKVGVPPGPFKFALLVIETRNWQ